MSWKTWSVVFLFSAAIAAPSHAALLISEVCFNEVGSDTTGEWIEIFNNGSSAVDLTNYKIGDEETNGGTSTTEAMFQFPSGASIGPGAVQIVAVSATRFNTVYGFLPTYESSSTDAGVPDLTIYSAWDPDGGQISMSNSNDQAVLLDPLDAIADATSWGNTFAFNPAVDITGNLDGQSIERIDPYSDTNTAADWHLGPTTSPAATRSTPGTVPAVPEPATLLIGVMSVVWSAFLRLRSD
jgi:hypothetical protein